MSLADTVRFIASMSAFVVFIELVKAHRSSLWAGTWSLRLDGIAAGYAVYFGVATVLSLALLACLKRFICKPLRRAYALVPGAVMLGLWLVVAACADEIRLATVLFVVMVLGAATVASLGGPWLRRTVTNLGIAAFCGVLMLVVADGRFYLSADRPNVITLWAFGVWAGVFALASLARTRNAAKHMPAAIAVAGVVIASGLMRSHSDSGADDPSLLLITADAARADWTDWAVLENTGDPEANFGLGTRPAVRYERCYSLAPWTLPSMIGMFTSQYPASISPGADEAQYMAELERYGVDEGAVLLAELLKERGYVTGACVANGLLYDPDGLLRGFDHTRLYSYRTHVRRGLLDNLPILQDSLMRVFPGVVDKRPADTTAAVTAYADRFLSRYRGRPFFLWLHYMDPHGPYAPPERYQPDDGGPPVFCPADPYWDAPPTDANGDIIVPESERAHIAALYRGEIQYVHEAIDGLLDKHFGEHGAGWPYICITSDHGEEFWDHGRQGHGQSLYDELVQVPLAITGPDIAPRSIHRPVSGLDVIPTLAGLVGLSPQDAWRGRALQEALRDELVPVPAESCFAQATNPIVTRHPLQMIVGIDCKLIRELGTNRIELYGVAVGALLDEQENTAEKEPRTVDALLGVLDEWSNSFPATFEERGDGTESTQPDSDVIQRLRGAGYL
ncbi:MAG: sulfatase [bacterium]|nr:sulfatase [bacterium]